MDARLMLAGTKLFEDLPAEDIADLAEHLETVAVSAGETICTKGDLGDAMFLVVDGAVSIYLPGEAEPVLIKTAQVGEHFGELSLFDDKPRSATAVARTD